MSSWGTPVLCVLLGMASGMLLASLPPDMEAGRLVMALALCGAGGVVGLALARDIRAHRRAERERERLISDLDAFAQTVAHDLKTPLTSIMGYAEMLADEFETLSEHDRRRFLWIIHHESRQMDRIIHEMLLFASVREQRDVPRRPLNMAFIVTTALGRMSYLITERHAEIHTPDGNWPIAQGYAPWVEEVWVNYLSNALKYGGTPPQIALGATVQPDGMVRFWVRDNGPGIVPEDQARIFEQFTRLHKIRASGYGMGLSIVKRIVEKLGGSVGVDSAPGEGSTFYFTLPPMPREDDAQ